MVSQQTSEEVSNFLNQFVEINRLYQDYARLTEENNRLKANESLIQSLENENTILRESLKVRADLETEKLMAKVVGREENNTLGYLMIDQGNDEGVRINMPVVIDNRLIGKVDEVYNSHARVRLISSSNSEIPVKILGDEKNETLCFLIGEFGLNMALFKLDQDAVVKEGDLVVTSGQGGTFPSGLLVGEVTQTIKKVETMLYQEAKVKPVVDFNKLQSVVILYSNYSIF